MTRAIVRDLDPKMITEPVRAQLHPTNIPRSRPPRDHGNYQHDYPAERS